ncbi:hypothetical protein AQUCO_01500006v1 [Aquilegia coerulea]|uniref:Uncharacterized protein n=1 Tax=Aquilegia coerulea TaxID=218851 RepID=A0A2G5DSG8_AQUCA|nr:hypothetical protein AQUCO_01500006v1 [Aquilegia coerulea]
MHFNLSKENKALKVKLMVKDNNHQKLCLLDYEDSDRVVKIENLVCIEIYGSCNGLNGNLYLASYGFGYNSKVNDYVIVRVEHNCDLSAVHVCSLRKNSWRTLPHVPFAVGYQQRTGASVNGYIHWQGSANPRTYIGKIIAFDIEGESFIEVPLPESISSKKKASFNMNVAEFEGQLCLVSYDETRYSNKNDIWVMKDYGLKESWTKLFSIEMLKSLFNKILKTITP